MNHIPQKTLVKICGIKSRNIYDGAITAGADFLGFVFYPPSPRFLTLQAAHAILKNISTKAQIVGLFVDPEDDVLFEATENLPLDIIQLHGHESPDRVEYIKKKFKKPIIKAFRLLTKTDLEQIKNYERSADWLLFDSQVEGALGGTGHGFNWDLLKDQKFAKPWMLAGGLNENNVQDAINLLKPHAIDVSSGVESQLGVKDIEKIKNLIKNVKQNEQE